MPQGKTLRDLVMLDRYIAEQEAELRRSRAAACAGSAIAEMAIRRALDALRARRQQIVGDPRR